MSVQARVILRLVTPEISVEANALDISASGVYMICSEPVAVKTRSSHFSSGTARKSRITLEFSNENTPRRIYHSPARGIRTRKIIPHRSG